MDVWTLLVLPLTLGLLGFVEPCTVGGSLLLLKQLESRAKSARLRATVIFAVARAGFIGSLGVMAASVGSAFGGLQRGFWVGLGAAYVLLGTLYLMGRQGAMMRTLGPALRRAGETRSAVALGLVFGLNIPACAAPILAAMTAASAGVRNVTEGFLAMALFGLALSLPLVAVVSWPRARAGLDRAARVADRLPVWTGVIFVVLGVWSILLGLTGSGHHT